MGADTQEAEFVIRLALQGMTYIMQITGQGAAHIAAMLQALKNQPDNSPGAKRLASMLKSGESLRVFTITEKNLPEFAKEAKRYGCQYCIAERSGENVEAGTYDLLVKELDAVRINHIIDRLQLATVDGMVDTDVSEEKKHDAVELTEAQKMLSDLFSPNKSERAEEALKSPGGLEPEEDSQSEGSYKTTDNRSSIREMLKENKTELESTMDMFRTARNLRTSFMSDSPVKDDNALNTGWQMPEEDYNDVGEKLYRGKTADEMTPKDMVQHMVDNEMAGKGKLSEEFIGRLYESGYTIDEHGLVWELETGFTSRERKIIVEMMHEPGETAKSFDEIREAVKNG